MKLTKTKLDAKLGRAARTAREKIRETSARIAPKLTRAAHRAGQRIRQAEEAVVEKLHESVDRTRAALSSEQKAFVVGRTAQRDVRGRNGRVVVAGGKRITRVIAQQAERQGVLDKLYRAAGGSLVREFAQASKNLLTMTGEQLRKGARRAKETAAHLWQGASGNAQPHPRIPRPSKRRFARKSSKTSRSARRE